MYFMTSGMNSFASAYAGASFGLLLNLRDAVLASVFVIAAVLVQRIIIVHSSLQDTEF